jgi:putative flippase GtrA
MRILFSILPYRLQARAYEVVLFVIVGLLNTAVDFVVLNLLILLTHHDSGLWLIIFTCLGFLAAVLNSYMLNGRLTFRGQTSRTSHRFIRFIAVNAVGMIINSSIVWLMVQIIGDRLSTIAAINVSKVLAVMCSLCWNYFAIKRWVFNGQTTNSDHRHSSSQEVPIPQMEKQAREKNLHHSVSMRHWRKQTLHRVVLVREEDL